MSVGKWEISEHFFPMKEIEETHETFIVHPISQFASHPFLTPSIHI